MGADESDKKNKKIPALPAVQNGLPLRVLAFMARQAQLELALQQQRALQIQQAVHPLRILSCLDAAKTEKRTTGFEMPDLLLQPHAPMISCCRASAGTTEMPRKRM